MPWLNRNCRFGLIITTSIWGRGEIADRQADRHMITTSIWGRGKQADKHRQKEREREREREGEREADRDRG